MIHCPVCHECSFVVMTAGWSHYCSNVKCDLYLPFQIKAAHAKANKPKLVIEIKNGSLLGVFADADLDIVLVDYDEIEGGSSAVVVADKIDDMPPETRRLAVDAVERSR